MLSRFSLYGALKNQRYFEPFLLLAMRDAGLSFAQIGVLIAIREATTATLEIPSGAIADVLGRRRAMVFAFVVYVAAYIGLAMATGLVGFTLGIAAIGVGDAFRTGTHKAMIFDWLQRQGRQDDRVEVYGYTRSWSQIGSAISIPIAAVAVYLSGQYALVFWLAAVPAALNVFNLATYPAELDGRRESTSLADIGRHLWRSLRASMADVRLRRLLIEAAAFGGTYKVLKDYLQPVVAGVAVAIVALDGLPAARATAIVAGAVYVSLYIVSALAARNAHRVVRRLGLGPAALWIWVVTTGLYAAISAGLFWGVTAVAIIGFIGLAVLHNLFRPLLVSRIDACKEGGAGATTLSVESQATALAAIVVAPSIGWAVDAAASVGSLGPTAALWPATAIAGAIATLTILAVVRR